MNRLVPLLAALAVPAAAQQAPMVQAQGSTCTLTAAEDATNILGLSYDIARQELTLSTANEVVSALPDSGELDFAVVFAPKRGDEYDYGWATRRFSYAREGDLVRFTTRFAGQRNVEQFLSDVAESRRLGFADKGQFVIQYDLTDLPGSIAELRACAARAGRGSA